MLKIFRLTFFYTFFFISCLSSYEFDLAICTIFRDEADYIKEFVDFHLAQGVQKFYLYDNLSVDNPEIELLDYIESGIVEYIPWPYEHQDHDEWIKIQSGAYNDCLSKIRKKVRWCAFIDSDEFLFSPKNKDLKKMLKHYKNYGGVAVHWQIYGTGFCKKAPKGKLVKNLLYRAEKDFILNGYIKTIAYVDRIKFFANVHIPNCLSKYEIVREDKSKIEKMHIENVMCKKFRINHYTNRDEYFFYNRKLKRCWVKKDHNLWLDATSNQVKDDIAVRIMQP